MGASWTFSMSGVIFSVWAEARDGRSRKRLTVGESILAVRDISLLPGDV